MCCCMVCLMFGCCCLCVVCVNVFECFVCDLLRAVACIVVV